MDMPRRDPNIFSPPRGIRGSITLFCRMGLCLTSQGWMVFGSRYQSATPMNSLFAIAPYKFQDFWVFDDPRVGLLQEPFVSGADTIIDVLTENIPNAAEGFKLVFSAQPFPGYSARFAWARHEMGGNWYSWPDRDMEGWLCPALFKYFDATPPELFVKVSAK